MKLVLIKYSIGLIINAVVFVLLFYSADTINLFVYPILLPIVCTVVGYKITKKWWFGLASFFSNQVLYFGVYETIESMSLNRTFFEQLSHNYLSGVEGRWFLVFHVLALFISFITSLIIYRKIRGSFLS